MKKKIVFAVAALAAASAFADISVTWQGSIGFYNWNVVGSPTDPDYINANSDTATAYLFWSADSTIDEINGSNVAGGLDAAGGDTMIASGSVGNFYGDYSPFSQIYVGSYENAFVYLRIVDSANVPGGGVQYYNSSVYASGPAYNPGAPATVFVEHNSAGAITSGLGDRMVLVPEPATYAFLGLGGLLLALRRLRRS